MDWRVMTSEYLNNKMFEAIIAKFQQSKQDKMRYELIIDDLSVSLERSTSKERAEMLRCKKEQYKSVNRTYSESQQLLATEFFTLSENIVRYARYMGVDPDDAIQEGVMICFLKIDRFDPAKGKAFNYMTTCILNHYRQLYRTQRNYKELKRKYLEFVQNSAEQTITQNGKERVNFSLARDRFSSYN
jgi:DNA-directed RNA polymerase specialized sigma subunit